ncbi:hypothetical protein TNCV_2591001 [Trichonephila clavipes]|nr:hypothetical protein TNCV_2591001 [Trichonephila clavipes]
MFTPIELSSSIISASHPPPMLKSQGMYSRIQKIEAQKYRNQKSKQKCHHINPENLWQAEWLSVHTAERVRTIVSLFAVHYMISYPLLEAILIIADPNLAAGVAFVESRIFYWGQTNLDILNPLVRISFNHVVPFHVGIDGNEKADFLVMTAAEEAISPTGSYVSSYLVLLGTPEEIQKIHSAVCPENIRIPFRLLWAAI